MQRSFKSIFLYSLASYILIMSINLSAFIFVYYRSQQTMRKQAVENITWQLRRGMDLFEGRLDEIEESSIRIGGDPTVAEFSRIGLNLLDRDYYQLLRLGSEFQRFNLNTKFVDSVYLVFRNSNVVVSTFYANPSFEWIFRHFLKYENLTYEEWKDDIDLWSRRKVIHQLASIQTYQETMRALTYKIPITVAGTEPKAVLLAIIPERSIRTYMQELLNFNARIEIMTPDGIEIYSAGKRMNDFKSAIDVEISGGMSGLTYRVVVPESYVRERTSLIQALFFAILFATIVCGFIAAIFFALRTSRPFARMFGLLERSGRIDTSATRFRYSVLEKSMAKLIGDQIDIRKALERRSQLLLNGFFERLLRGGFADGEEIQEYIVDLQLDFAPQAHLVAIVKIAKIGSTSKDPVQEILFHDVLSSHKPEDWHLHRTQEGEALIISAGERAIEMLDAVMQEICKKLKLTFILSVGTARRELLDMRESFSEAYLALRNAVHDFRGPRIVYYESREELGEKYLFSREDRVHLENAVLSGDDSQLVKIAEKIKAANFGVSELNTTGVQRLFREISSCMVNILSGKEITAMSKEGDHPVRYLDRYTSVDDFFGRFLHILSPICRNQNQRLRDHREVVAERLADFVRSRHRDPMLSLQSLAEQFDLNPQYVCRLFKEQVGTPFSRYLETIRMEEAKTAMVESNQSLSAISTEIGYMSWNSFYKAFRRNHGMSPGKYRDRQSANEL